METDRDVLHVSAFAGSLRRGSWNRRLLDAAADAVGALPAVEVDVVDLRRHPLPIYDADIQGRDGIPSAVYDVHDRIAASDAVLVANPEYNGGYPAVFKNTVDWISRIDMLIFHPRYVGLLSTTPGKKGGVRGLEHTRELFSNMFVTTHPDAFSLPFAPEVLGEDATVAPALQSRLDEWAAEFVAGARAFRDERAEVA